MVLEHCKSKTKNLSVAWIDYKKAFDSIPHDWIIKAMEMYKVAPEINNFVKISMKTWKTTLTLNHGDGSITSRGGARGATAPPSGNLSLPVGEKLTIRRGIFTDRHTYILHKL